MGVSTVVAGALGFSMQALLSHRLAPADYGVAFSVLTLLLVVWLPSNALMLVIARETSRDRAADRSAQVMWLWHRYVMVGGLALAGLCVVSAGWLSRFFNLPAAALVAAALSIPFGLAIPILFGRLQGQQRFSNFSLLLVVQAGLRLVAAVSLALFMGAVGMLIGVAIGNLVVYLVALAMVGARSRPRAGRLSDSSEVLRSLAVILPSSLASTVLFGTDVLLAKHYLSIGDAGRYAAVAALGRAIFWGTTGIAIVLFPKAAAHQGRGSSGFGLVVSSMGLCLLGGIAGLAVLSLGAGFILTAFAGPAYASAGAYLPWYAIAMTFFGGASVLVANEQARGRASFLGVLIPITLMEPLLIIRFHQSASQIAQVLTLSMALLFVGLACLYLIQERVRDVPRVAYEAAAS